MTSSTADLLRYQKAANARALKKMNQNHGLDHAMTTQKPEGGYTKSAVMQAELNREPEPEPTTQIDTMSKSAKADMLRRKKIAEHKAKKKMDKATGNYQKKPKPTPLAPPEVRVSPPSSPNSDRPEEVMGVDDKAEYLRNQKKAEYKAKKRMDRATGNYIKTSPKPLSVPPVVISPALSPTSVTSSHSYDYAGGPLMPSIEMSLESKATGRTVTTNYEEFSGMKCKLDYEREHQATRKALDMVNYIKNEHGEGFEAFV